MCKVFSHCGLLFWQSTENPEIQFQEYFFQRRFCLNKQRRFYKGARGFVCPCIDNRIRDAMGCE